MQLSASAEKGSEHPLGEAIVNEAKDKNLELVNIDSFEAIPGHGIEVVIEGKNMLLGNKKLMDDRKIEITLQKESDKLAEEGKTPMFVAIDNRLAGIIAVADVMKPSSKRAIEALHSLGIEVAMITGDNKEQQWLLPDRQELTGSWQKYCRRIRQMRLRSCRQKERKLQW